LAPVIFPWIALTWGWQVAFIVAGVAGFVWLFFWIPFYDLPERQSRLSRDELAFIQSDRDESHTESSEKSRWLSLLKYRQAWSIVVARFMTDPIWWFFLIWLPDYFKKTRHLDIQHSWIHLAAIYTIDKFQATGNVTAGYSILFVICAFAYLMAFALNHLCAPKFEPARLDQ
jgi:ACS family hexuronate transporter-like MFS transporter